MITWTGGSTMRGLAFRRHQWQRAKQRAHHYLRWLFAGEHTPPTDKQIIRYANDRKPCSCWMCGNPRRWFGQVTRSELQAETDLGR